MLLSHAPLSEQAKLALTFDATISATDFVRKWKKREADSARSPLLLTHLPVTAVVALVHEFSDDAERDKTCLPAIQEQVKQATSKPARTHGAGWKFIRRRNE